MTIDLVYATKLMAPGITRTALAQIKRKTASGNDDARGAIEETATDEAVYVETIRLMRQMLKLTCVSGVEDLHFATKMHSPTPPSVRIDNLVVPASHVSLAAELVQKQLGPNLDCVGRAWWQWRDPKESEVKAQWVEMKVDYEERMRKRDKGTKVMFYLHGGAYYLGGFGHDVQIQRHARKLKGRCFAPRYRLAPLFPFPCAIQDILSAYLYLMTMVPPEHVVIAGDSAGGGLCLALLQIIRDQGLPMPAGASLISPWVDLTHSFPSITQPTKYDYVPATGFHAKPTLAWPPPTPAERRALGMKLNPLMPPDYVVEINDTSFKIESQVNMYAENLLLQLPLVSPVHAATLGGFCPCQVIVGGAEILRDEQLYLAHKMADPSKFPLSDRMVSLNHENPKDQLKFPPTDVELLVFDDGPHAAPTLGHIDVAKYQYRAISAFSAWALARAQNVEIEIEDFGGATPPRAQTWESGAPAGAMGAGAGAAENSGWYFEGSGNAGNVSGLRAGDSLPAFEDHMRRFRVSRLGKIYGFEAPATLQALNMPLEDIGEVKGEALQGWIEFKKNLDAKFASEKKKVFQKRMENARKGFMPVPNNEIPPPSALVGRRVIGEQPPEIEPGSVGNSLLGKLLRRMDKGGLADNGRKDTMESGNLSSKRASRIVRPAPQGAPGGPASSAVPTGAYPGSWLPSQG